MKKTCQSWAIKTTTWQRNVKATLYQKNYESSSLWSKMEIEKRKNGLKILPSIVLLKALELSKDVKYNISEGDFKARNHWCQRFMKRKNLSLRQKTTLAQHLPDDYEEKIVRFHCFIIDRRKVHVQHATKPNNTGEKTVKIRGAYLLVDLASVEWHSSRNDHCFVSEVWDTNNLDGSEDDLLFDSAEDTELDD